MKKLIKFLLIVFLINQICAKNIQQEQLIIKLTHSEQPGFLEFDHYKGSIKVEGYKGNFVTVEATVRGLSEKDYKRLIKQNSVKLSATEKENKIRIENNSYKNTIDVTIRVPYNFSLKLSTYDNGSITVRNVSGEIEINNYNGDIFCHNISGSTVLSSVDGDIVVDFGEITKDKPMVFTTVEGKIDVTLPKSTGAELKLKSQYGDIFSDFKIDLKTDSQKIEKSLENNTTKYSFDDYVSGNINNGGALYLFKSLNGNIFIRKR